MSQFGSLHGLDDLEAPRKLEAMPYVVTKNASQIVNNALHAASRTSTLGGDLKYRVAPNLTLDATINPDFGQVESDPAVLNLSAYESFFDERRPFFVAGRGLFRFDVNCSAGQLQRRRTLLQSAHWAHAASSPASTATPFRSQPMTIIGAAKLLGRFPHGLDHRRARRGDATRGESRRYDLRSGDELRCAARDAGFPRRATAPSAAIAHRGESQHGPMVVAVSRVERVCRRARLPSSLLQEQLRDLRLVRPEPRARKSGGDSRRCRQNGVHYYQRPDADLPLDSESHRRSAATPRSSSSARSADSI